MNKLKSLRDYLLNARLPQRLQPENVTAMTRGGKIISYYRRDGEGGINPHNQKFHFEYTAQLFIMDYTGDEGVLFFLLTTWLDENVPNHREDVISVTVEQLNHDSADILIEIEGLKDTYNPRERADGISIGSCEAQEIDEIIGVWGENNQITAEQDDEGPYA